MSLNFRTGPTEKKLECALCGALFSHGLTRCPYCGTSPHALEADEQDAGSVPSGPGLLDRLRSAVHSLLGIPYSAEEVFGSSLNPADLYDDLLGLLGGDQPAADRLVKFEHLLLPSATRCACIRNAIRRLKPDEDGGHQARPD